MKPLKLGVVILIIVIIISSISIIWVINRPIDNQDDDLNTYAIGSADNITLNISVNKNQILADESFTLNFTLKNEGDNMIRLIPLSSGFDILITDLEGNEIYNYRALMGINIYGNDSFVELYPDEEIFHDFSIIPPNLHMNDDEIYLIQGFYSTTGGYQNVVEVYWEGSIATGQIKISLI